MGVDVKWFRSQLASIRGLDNEELRGWEAAKLVREVPLGVVLEAVLMEVVEVGLPPEIGKE